MVGGTVGGVVVGGTVTVVVVGGRVVVGAMVVVDAVVAGASVIVVWVDLAAVELPHAAVRPRTPTATKTPSLVRYFPIRFPLVLEGER